MTKNKPSNLLLPWLDVLAIAAWGILLLKYKLTGQLNLLVHQNYFWPIAIAGVGLLFVSALLAKELLFSALNRTSRQNQYASVGHVTLFPPGWSSTLLLIAAILGLLFAPKPFTSQTALARGVTESLNLTRSRPQTFRTANARETEKRSLIGWVRQLNVYPEPDAYVNNKVKVRGFAVHTDEFPSQYLIISQFVITCCAADAYPVGLPVKLTESRQKYPPDTWLEVEGKAIVETLKDKRQLVIEASNIKKIQAPENPYDY